MMTFLQACVMIWRLRVQKWLCTSIAASSSWRCIASELIPVLRIGIVVANWYLPRQRLSQGLSAMLAKP
jgi:hypothetical protein